ncbi:MULTISPECIES: YibE/F family protein [unclassified Leucobacter]|uniref:YibE/F family protein n=1 Tax=unclassified Leucobacter TaxID=2621730 RepID=UPI0013046B8A|nr:MULTISPECIES: YibE/F family protein [unclassified Leucobacter]
MDKHTHGHGRPPTGLEHSRTAVRVALPLLLAVALLTGLGLALLWPNAGEAAKVIERVPFAGPGTIFVEGEVVSVDTGCGDGTQPRTGAATSGADPDRSCLTIGIGITSGPDTGRVIDVPARGSLASSGLQPRDTVELLGAPRAEPPAGDPRASDGAASERYSYSISGIHRGLALVVLSALFLVVLLAVGRLRGLLALGALALSGGVILAFVLPAIVTGAPGALVGIVGSFAIVFIILYPVHGPNLRTTAALVGTLCGILITAGISTLAVHATRLSGLGDEAAARLSGVAGSIDFRGMLTCAIIIAGLGVLNDVTITQASAVWELRAAAPHLGRGEIAKRAMRIGRDHIASTVYTIVFAYAGASLGVLILLALTDRPLLSTLTGDDLVTEIVRTLCGSIGLVLAMPITTWIAAAFLPPVETGTETAAQLE